MRLIVCYAFRMTIVRLPSTLSQKQVVTIFSVFLCKHQKIGSHMIENLQSAYLRKPRRDIEIYKRGKSNS